MRKVIWCALVLALCAGGAWWASDRGDELASVDPAPVTEVAAAVRPAAPLVPAGATASERNAIEHAAVPAVIDAEAPIHAPPTILQPPTLATLEGRVVDAMGDALAARLELVHPETGASHLTEMALGYRFDDVEPGSWWIRVTNDRRSPVCERIELEPGSNRRDFTLSDSTAIEVHLETRSGEPLADALEASGQRSGIPYVFATLEPPGTERLAVDGGERLSLGWFEDGGRLQVARNAGRRVEPTAQPDAFRPRSWVGTLHVPIDPPFHVAVAGGMNVLDSARIEPGTKRVTLNVELVDVLWAWASVRLRVVAADTGEPLPGAFVRVASWSSSMKLGLSKPDGTFHIEQAEPGSYRLTVEYPGFVGTGVDVDLAPGEDSDLGTIELVRCEPRGGLVVDPFGAGVDAKLEVRTVLTRSSYLFVVASAPDGRFTLPLDHADGLQLRVRPMERAGFDGKLASRIVCVDPDNRDQVVVALARCSSLVLRPRASVRTGWRYDVVDEAGSRYARGNAADAVPITIELPVGRYEVVIVDAHGDEHRHPMQLGEQPLLLDVLGG